MKARMKTLGLAALCLVALVGGAFGSSHHKDGETPGKAPSADEQAMMDAVMKLATPGDAHKKLDRSVGTFDATVKMWMKPGAPPDVSQGKLESKWILDGRFVQDTFTGTAMGQPFTGMGLTGYDNHKKQYVGSWIDTWSTHMQTMTGDMDASGKALTMTSTIFDPMAGKEKKIRSVTRFVDDKTHTYETFEPGPDGKEIRTMEITFTRR